MDSYALISKIERGVGFIVSTIWHTDTLTEFNHKLYTGLLKREHIVTHEIATKFREESYFGYILEKEDPKTKLKDRFFLKTLWDNPENPEKPINIIERLPIKVVDSEKFSYRGEVFKFVLNPEVHSIPTKKVMSFRDMVEYFANYKHSNDIHWKLARIITLAANTERLNIRIVSEAAFGKDALVDIIQILNGNVANLYNATLAKLKYSLHKSLIVINELGGLKQEEVGRLQTYLTQAGCWKPFYENDSRGHKGTKEVMDIHDKSHIIYHNTKEYYENKGQQYFEQMFTKAIYDRFPAILLEGYVTEDFSDHASIGKFTEKDMTQLKGFISSLNYCRENPIINPKFEVSEDFWGFTGRQRQRSLRTFKIIAKYIAEWASSKEEFEEMCTVLNDSRKKYLSEDIQVQIKEERIK